jgi:hypothetical protein
MKYVFRLENKCKMSKHNPKKKKISEEEEEKRLNEIK